MDKHVVAVLACRSESTRLYGKPLQLIGEKEILDHQVSGLQRAPPVDEIALAISDMPSKQSYISFAESNGLEYVVGSNDDVLNRVNRTIDATDADIIVRITTENPYGYWQQLDELVTMHIEREADYTVPRILPLGTACEIIDPMALKRSHEEGEDRHRSENVTLFIREHPEKFSIETLTPPTRFQRPDVRLTVDNPIDLVLAREIYARLPEDANPISLPDAMGVLDREPELVEINADKPDGTSEKIRSLHGYKYGTQE
jgi:spore coat polysaccharide biosynthesis protein SpsF